MAAVKLAQARKKHGASSEKLGEAVFDAADAYRKAFGIQPSSLTDDALEELLGVVAAADGSEQVEHALAGAERSMARAVAATAAAAVQRQQQSDRAAQWLSQAQETLRLTPRELLPRQLALLVEEHAEQPDVEGGLSSQEVERLLLEDARRSVEAMERRDLWRQIFVAACGGAAGGVLDDSEKVAHWAWEVATDALRVADERGVPGAATDNAQVVTATAQLETESAG